MSDKERRRLGLMVMVESGDLKLTDASEILGVSYRQVKRIRKRYCEEGDKARTGPSMEKQWEVSIARHGQGNCPPGHWLKPKPYKRDISK